MDEEGEVLIIQTRRPAKIPWKGGLALMVLTLLLGSLGYLLTH